MKLMRLAPALSLLAVVAGSSAFAQDTIIHRYDVFSTGAGCGVMTQPAVLESTSCAPAVIEAASCRPAVIAAPTCGDFFATSCEKQTVTIPAVITGRDPYLPLWQQAVLDTAGNFDSICGVPNVAEIAPACTMTQAAVVEGCGQVLTQPAVIDSGCGTQVIMTQPAVMDSCPAVEQCAPKVITKPVFIQGIEPSEVRIINP